MVIDTRSLNLGLAEPLFLEKFTKIPTFITRDGESDGAVVAELLLESPHGGR